jgi:hypothetical protein
LGLQNRHFLQLIDKHYFQLSQNNQKLYDELDPKKPILLISIYTINITAITGNKKNKIKNKNKKKHDDNKHIIKK